MCHEAQSLHLRYGLDIALSTLNSCRHLHEPKTRFPVGRLFPFPGRESHPLKAPGLPWRTKVAGQININYRSHSPHHTAPDFRQGTVWGTLGSKSVRVRTEVCLEDGFEDQLQCSLHHAIADAGNLKRPDFAVPFRDVYPAVWLGFVPSAYKVFPHAARKPVSPSFSMSSKLWPSMPGAPPFRLPVR